MILIVDFGSQMTHLIGRRLRQIGVDYRFAQPEDALSAIAEREFSGVVLSGGPSSVYEEGAPTIESEFFESGLPVLGICYGWQLMAQKLGGEVKSASKEYGPEQLRLRAEDATSASLNPLAGLRSVFSLDIKGDKSNDEFSVFMSHGDSVVELPDGFEVFASTKNVPNAGVWNVENKLMGTQFHPEAAHTEHGLDFLKFFAHDWCGESVEMFELSVESIIEGIKKKVGDKKVICAVSGGVDSTVAAFLIGKAIGSNLIPVYVESGLMRSNTREYVERVFTDLVDADLVVLDVKDRFMQVLRGKEDPEEKRKAIGNLYVELFNEEAVKHDDVTFLGQGTIYSDVIESKGTKNASHIKSHHNVGGLPKEMTFELLEPMREYYKDEVRELGRMAGLPEALVGQHPFPGPGQAVRIRGEVTEKRLSQQMQADDIVMEEVRNAGLYDRLFQVFPIMTGAYSTAVKGDARAFAEVVALRGYESYDIMTAGWAHLPYDLLQKISSRIVNEVPDVSRVVYDITSKPPATMEWE